MTDDQELKKKRKDNVPEKWKFQKSKILLIIFITLHTDSDIESRFPSESI